MATRCESFDNIFIDASNVASTFEMVVISAPQRLLRLLQAIVEILSSLHDLCRFHRQGLGLIDLFR